jgi:hypothetical protein
MFWLYDHHQAAYSSILSQANPRLILWTSTVSYEDSFIFTFIFTVTVTFTFTKEMCWGAFLISTLQGDERSAPHPTPSRRLTKHYAMKCLVKLREGVLN